MPTHFRFQLSTFSFSSEAARSANTSPSSDPRPLSPFFHPISCLPSPSSAASDYSWALRDVSFEVNQGEVLGIIGRNGAGKSTLLKMLNGLIKPDSGRITMRGRDGALIALGAGFNPLLTGRENIVINGSMPLRRIRP